MPYRFLLLTTLSLLAGALLSSCAPYSGPNPFSASGDGRVYNPATHNYETPGGQ